MGKHPVVKLWPEGEGEHEPTHGLVRFLISPWHSPPPEPGVGRWVFLESPSPTRPVQIVFSSTWTNYVDVEEARRYNLRPPEHRIRREVTIGPYAISQEADILIRAAHGVLVAITVAGVNMRSGGWEWLHLPSVHVSATDDRYLIARPARETVVDKTRGDAPPDDGSVFALMGEWDRWPTS